MKKQNLLFREILKASMRTKGMKIVRAGKLMAIINEQDIIGFDAKQYKK